jgi:hypothetical protein
MTEQDLSPAEIVTAIRAFSSEVGPRTYCSVSISTSGDSRGVVMGVCYPDGMGYDKNRPQFYVYGNTFRDVVAKLSEGWAERCKIYYAETIKRMAVTIITITYDIGECSDNALRGSGFDASEVKRFSAAACELANTMADRGPFTVLTLDNSNEAL